MVTIQPAGKDVSSSRLNSVKDMIEKNGFSCQINTSVFKNGDALPPPPPPSPDAYVAFNYKNGGKEQGLIVYERYLQMRLTSGSTVFIMMIFHLLLLLYIRKHRMVCLMVLKNI